jgi:cation:H+ antiporter
LRLPFSALALFLVAAPLYHSNPWAILWTAPCILIASLLITWGAESAQFFVAQGFALAILAWMQTLPEFAVEAVLAWRQQTGLLLANLTGALRLLTGLVWPMIYATAATVHRRRERQPLRRIELDSHHSVEVIGLFFPLLYAVLIWWKRSLHIYDAGVLIAFYAAYLWLLTQLPPQAQEGLNDLEAIPRAIALAPRRWRILSTAGCFAGGGALIYFTAEPFLGSLIALAGAIAVPSFMVIQWFAPVISEFPEIASTFYFARQKENASIALMNIASSNINQWTLLVALLPIALSLSRGAVATIPLNAQQRSELLLTIGQSAVAMTFLLNMEFDWREALAMFSLFAAQFILPAFFGSGVRVWITAAFFAWIALAVVQMAARGCPPKALASFAATWRAHIGSTTPKRYQN